jgi:hypothetical protein
MEVSELVECNICKTHNFSLADILQEAIVTNVGRSIVCPVLGKSFVSMIVFVSFLFIQFFFFFFFFSSDFVAVVLRAGRLVPVEEVAMELEVPAVKKYPYDYFSLEILGVTSFRISFHFIFLSFLFRPHLQAKVPFPTSIVPSTTLAKRSP